MAANPDKSGLTLAGTIGYVDCPHDGDTDYAVATGWGKAADYTPAAGAVRGLLCDAGSGNIALTMQNGGEMTIPLTVGSGTFTEILRGAFIKTIKKTGTTFDGHIWPMF